MGQLYYVKPDLLIKLFEIEIELKIVRNLIWRFSSPRGADRADRRWVQDDESVSEHLRNYVFKNFHRLKILDFILVEIIHLTTGALQHWTGGFVSLIYLS